MKSNLDKLKWNPRILKPRIWIENSFESKMIIRSYISILLKLNIRCLSVQALEISFLVQYELEQLSVSLLVDFIWLFDVLLFDYLTFENIIEYICFDENIIEYISEATMLVVVLKDIEQSGLCAQSIIN